MPGSLDLGGAATVKLDDLRDACAIVGLFLWTCRMKSRPEGRIARTAAKRLLHFVFNISQRFGMNVLPMHYYSTVPNMRDLGGRDDWKKPRSMRGIAMRPIADQLQLLSSLLSCFPIPINDCDLHRDAVIKNGADGYGTIEADVLAAVIAGQKPQRIIQVGCGVSTAIILAAADAASYIPDITCIDPFPTKYLIGLEAKGQIILLAKPEQLVDIDIFKRLDSGDLLFIDSTHAVKIGSEVNHLVLEVLPALRSGVMVHFHDICFPYEYQPDFMSDDIFFPGETTLLYAYLADNPKFRIDLCMSMLHYSAQEELKKLISRYDPQGNDHGLRSKNGQHFPSSIYLSRLA